MVGDFRQQLENAVLKRYGRITAYSAALIKSACDQEARALLLQRWLCLKYDSLDTMGLIRLMDGITRATITTHKGVERLLGVGGTDGASENEPGC
jgi:hypothetical protein